MVAGFDIPGYVDVEQIGAGGFGRVFRARQPAFDRTVAIKILNGRLDDAATVRRFQRECQALGSVSSHPNIVPVYDAGGTPDGVPYLVMDYVRGGSLADRLARSGPLPWPDVAMIGVKIAGALHSAHAAGVLHRDIKPENILVSGYGEPQLADFGIAQRAGIENRTTTAAAMTPSHTAPEQFSGSPPTERTDVYALASTLFTLLAGASPFQGRPDESIFALIARSATDPVPDLRPRGVPDALTRVIEAGLAKDPAARPATALDFGRMLQEAQQSLGTGVTALPVAQDDASSFRPTGFAGFPGGITPGGVTPGGVTPGGITPGGVTPGGITPGGSYPPGRPPESTPSTATTQARLPLGAPPPYPGSQGPQGNPGSPGAYAPPPPYAPAAYGTPPHPGAGTGGPGTGGPGTGGRSGPGRALALAAAAVVLVIAAVVITVVVTRGGGPTTAGPAATSTGTTSRSDPGTPTPTGTPATSTDAVTDTSTETSGSESTSTQASTDTAPSDGGSLASLLLAPGEAPLSSWTDGSTSLLGSINAEGTDFFCGKTVDLTGEKASTTLTDGTEVRLIDEHLYRVGTPKATQAMSQLRASARCGSWTHAGTKITVTQGSAVRAGDDAVAYYATTTQSGVPLETYQAFARRGGDVVVLSLVVIGQTITSAERDLVAKSAAAAVAKLGT